MSSVTTLIVKEYETIDIPAALIIDGIALRIYPAVLERDYISVRWKKGVPIFQAGGYIGVIPINDQLTLDVRPKVPLVNLERILYSSNHKPYVLESFQRAYGHHTRASEPIETFLVDRFLDWVEEIHRFGLLKQYRVIHEDGFTPRGRLNFAATIRLRSRNQQSLAYQWDDRTADNGPNRFIKAVLLQLADRDEFLHDRRRKARLSVCVDYFSSVSDVDVHSVLIDPLVDDVEQLPSTREYYKTAIVLAKMLIEKSGLAFLSDQHSVLLPTLLLDLDEAFEKYVLTLLQQVNIRRDDVRVFDGNIDGALGGKKQLLKDSGLENQVKSTVQATPDVLVEKYSIPSIPRNLVIDMKYKEVKNIVERGDLNQVIAYAASYQSAAAVFILPSRGPQQRGLQCLGTVAEIPIFNILLISALPILRQKRKP
ncbi:5-methylcytosine restriction system specificity protein McrC [Cupriavidus metallidurans]|uniref:Restriction endonuclease n=1 Tax=Cupriavidus metallidurans (strain ATCC 43123 / DSM 2839 / NBRC 102507 / CH34) TaxID=266264 RepID=Q1LJY6_CUPMC|nr:hypothetical protein [Cupriavidus metallidurans]ABF09540.1 hypothetical protein Rmet_2667 [Cupriavidus metallidurans CH34]QGS29604.1 hypothetical protein FOB83_12315 [Cupriavidus metallidurans]